MPSLPVILIVVIGIVSAGAAAEGYLLKKSYERNGALETALDTAARRLSEINKVQKERDAIHGTNSALSDDQLFEGLLR